MKTEYLILLAAVGFFPFILSFDRKLGMYRQTGALLKAIALVCLSFWIWDIAATARGHWWFNDAYVLGLSVLGLPIEEWLFFVVVSFVSIFTWESTKFFLGRKQ